MCCCLSLSAWNDQTLAEAALVGREWGEQEVQEKARKVVFSQVHRKLAKGRARKVMIRAAF